MVNYMDWVVTSGYEQALKAYNDWVFGPNPVNNDHHPPLFVSGTIGSPEVRSESRTIDKGSLIVVHVIGVNYVYGDDDSQGSRVDGKTRLKKALEHSAEKEDRLVYVKFKAKQETSWIDLTRGVKSASMEPFKFNADPSNRYLNDWDDPMDSGDHTGAWSSKLLLMKIPVAGDFELISRGIGIKGYEQNTDFKIKVV
jgi:hypothetical protein